MHFEETVLGDLEPIKLKPEQKDKLVRDAIEKRRNWHDMTNSYRETAIEVRQLYFENRPDAQSFTTDEAGMDGRSNVRMPVIAQAVDSTLAQQHLGTFPTDENFYTLIPRNEESKSIETAYGESIDRRLKMLNFISKTKMDRLNAMLDGVSCAWHPFKRKIRKRSIRKQKKLLGFPMGESVKTYIDKIYFEGTDFIPLNLEDWWIDPTIDDFENVNLIWRQWVHISHIKEIDAYENTDEVAPYARFLDDQDSKLYENYRMIGFDVMTGQNEEVLAGNMAMLFEEWGDFYIDETLYENCVLVYSNESTFHGFFKNPYDHGYKPFSLSSYIPIPGTLMGKSIGRDIIPLAHAYDAFLNGAIDIINASAAPIWTHLINDTALVEYFSEGKRVISPGDTIPVQSHDSLRPYVTNLQNLDVIGGMMQKVKEEIRESTGGVPYATGGVSDLDTNRTATEVSTLASGTSTRYQDVIQNYEQMKLKHYLWMWFENDRQFVEEPLEAEDETIEPEQLHMLDFEFDITGSKASMTQAQEANALMGIINMIPNLLQLGVFSLKGDQVEIDINGMLKQVGRSQGARNIDQYLKTVMTQEELEQQQAMMGQTQGLEGMLLNESGQVDPTGEAPVVGEVQQGYGVANPEEGIAY